MRIIRPIFGLRVSAAVQQFFLLGLVVAVAVVMPHNPDSLVAMSVLGGGIMGAIMDAQTVLSDAQALTVTVASTNTYDSLAATTDISKGEPLAACFSVDVAAKTSNADETYQFQVIQSANADLSSPDILVQTDTTFIARATLVAGYRFYLPIPPGMKTKQYIGARYVLGGTLPTITVSADIRPLAMLQNEAVYPTGIKVS